MIMVFLVLQSKQKVFGSNMKARKKNDIHNSNYINHSKYSFIWLDHRTIFYNQRVKSEEDK